MIQRRHSHLYKYQTGSCAHPAAHITTPHRAPRAAAAIGFHEIQATNIRNPKPWFDLSWCWMCWWIDFDQCDSGLCQNCQTLVRRSSTSANAVHRFGAGLSAIAFPLISLVLSCVFKLISIKHKTVTGAAWLLGCSLATPSSCGNSLLMFIC